MRRNLFIVLVVAGVMLGGSSVQWAAADDIIERNAAGGAGLARSNVRIHEVRRETVEDQEVDVLVFRTAQGESRVPLRSIYTIRLDNDEIFNAAEAAYIEQRWPAAVDSYLRVMRANQDWRMRYVLPRLLDAVSRTTPPRADAGIAAKLTLLRIDPAAAAAVRLTLPARGSKLLDDAVRDAEALRRAAADPAQRTAILLFLADLHAARGDDEARLRIFDELDRLGVELGPEHAGLMGTLNLQKAQAALDREQFQKVITIVGENTAHFTDPQDQATALFYVAQARRHLVSADDTTGLLDAAVAYMKVVAHFRDAPGQPHVAESLLQAGLLLDKAGDIEGARSVLESLVADFDSAPQAAKAREHLAALQSSK